MLRKQIRFNSKTATSSTLFWIDETYDINKKKDMKAVVSNKELISIHKKLLNELKDLGFSKVTARKLCKETLDLTRMVCKKPDESNTREFLGNVLEDFIAKLQHIAPIKRNFKSNKVYFIPSKGKNYSLSFQVSNEAIDKEIKFNTVNTTVLKHITDNDIKSRSELNQSVIAEKHIQNILDTLEEETGSFIELGDLKIIEETPNDKILVQNYIYPGHRFGTCAKFAIGKDANDKSIKAIAKYILMHIVDKDPLCIKESDLPKSIIEIEGKNDNNKEEENNNKKYNNFLNKSVLLEQFLTSDPNYHQYGEYDEKKKRIKVKDYLKLNNLEILEFVRL